MEFSRLEGLKRQAIRDGWGDFIRTPVDEKALLKGFTFSFERYDHFRYFVETWIKLSKGRWKGEPMRLLPWHEVICGSIFGWVDETGLRRFRKGYIEIPKKNSKTTLAAAIGLYMSCDGEGSPEVYNCANDKDQAALLWGLAADMVELDPDLSARIRVLRSVKRLVMSNSAWFAAWSSDTSGKDGPNAYCILVDELHEWKGAPARDFWRKIRYAGIAREEPLCPLVITTAGDDKYSLCWEQHEAARAVLEGVSEDVRLFAAIYAANPKRIADDPDYWKTEECWIEANPSYELILKKEDFEADVAAAERDPQEKAAFLRYRLNVWSDSGVSWLDPGIWAANAGEPFTEEDLEGTICAGAFDFSSVHDFTSICYEFPYLRQTEAGTEKRFRVIWRYFVPEETFSDRVRKDATGSLRTWFEQGFITLTSGSAIDHEEIFAQIERDAKRFDLRQMAYDRNSAAWIIQQIQKQLPKVELFPFSQSTAGMSAPTKALKTALMRGKIDHGGNPVSAWQSSNAVAVEGDKQDNLILHKGKSHEKIDGIVAMVMAHSHAELISLDMKESFSPYSDEGFARIKEIEGLAKTQQKK